MYLYAVDPLMNVIVDADTFSQYVSNIFNNICRCFMHERLGGWKLQMKISQYESNSAIYFKVVTSS